MEGENVENRRLAYQQVTHQMYINLIFYNICIFEHKLFLHVSKDQKN